MQRKGSRLNLLRQVFGPFQKNIEKIGTAKIACPSDPCRFRQGVCGRPFTVLSEKGGDE